MNIQIRISPRFIAGFAFALCVLCVSVLNAQAPGATVTRINEKTGVVTAKVNSTGQIFEFTLANRALLARIRPGQGVFVNLGKKQVSLDGKSSSGSIVTILPLLKKPGSSTGSTPPASGSSHPGSFSCGGATNPLTADTCGKSGDHATNLGSVTCGSSVTITGNTFPAGSSDWLMFVVPTSLANCPTPELGLQLSNSVGTINFDVVKDVTGTPYQDGGNGNPTLNVWGAVLGNSYNPVAGVYYIRVHGYSTASVGSWTLVINGLKIPPAVSVSCGGTSDPLTADTCAKSASSATNLGTVSCGSSLTITGNTFPAGSSDWLTFLVPTSLANCPTPELAVRISQPAMIGFDLLKDAQGTACRDGVTGNPTLGVPGAAVLGNSHDPVVGSYYIRVHGYSASAVGAWTLTIKGLKTP